MKLWRNCDRLLTRCDQELVNVRRLQRETIRYKECQEEFYTALNMLEKRITWAALLD